MSIFIRHLPTNITAPFPVTCLPSCRHLPKLACRDACAACQIPPRAAAICLPKLARRDLAPANLPTCFCPSWHMPAEMLAPPAKYCLEPATYACQNSPAETLRRLPNTYTVCQRANMLLPILAHACREVAKKREACHLPAAACQNAPHAKTPSVLV